MEGIVKRDDPSRLHESEIERGSIDASTDRGNPGNHAPAYTHARIAVYDDLKSAPRILDIDPTSRSTREYIEELALQTYNLSHAAGGSIPYTVIREVSENFIHANFEEIVISILDEGNTVRFADQGPGIADKDKAQLPGFTSATSEMKEVIRGVGSGFPIVNEYLSVSGGNLQIDDNMRAGTVVTVSLSNTNQKEPGHRSSDDRAVDPAKLPTAQQSGSPSTSALHAGTSTQDGGGINAGGQGTMQSYPVQPEVRAGGQDDQTSPYTIASARRYMSLSQIKMTSREDEVMRLFLSETTLGPTDLKNRLGISLGTAYRTLSALEEAGYLETNPSKKRVLTEEGMEYLRERFNV